MWLCPECNREFEKKTITHLGTHTGINYYSPELLGQERFDEIEKSRKLKISQTTKERWQDPEYRERVLNRKKPVWSEEAKEKQAERMRQNREVNPELFLKASSLGGKANKGVIKKETPAVIEGRKRASEKKKQYVGENNWNYTGSSSSYPPEFNDFLRREIRERDSHICQDCGVKYTEGGDFHEAFDIHHIDGTRNNCGVNNLITLCRKCHAARHKAVRKQEQKELVLN